jgi:hypothetical protein
VYGNKNYTVTLANGSTMAQADKYGEISVSVNVSGPVIDPHYKSGRLKVQVYVNALDRTLKTVVSTGDKTVYVEDSKYTSQASGSAVIYIRGLTPGQYYDISIDNATCE